jgi:hypothetical protein
MRRRGGPDYIEALVHAGQALRILRGKAAYQGGEPDQRKPEVKSIALNAKKLGSHLRCSYSVGVRPGA